MICLLQVIMASTRNFRSFIPPVTIRKIGAKNCEAKYLASHMWCNSCSESSNRSTNEKTRPCCCPCVVKDDNKLHKKHYYFIQDYFNNVLQPPSKKKNARYSSTSTCNIVQDSNDNIALNSHVNVNEDIDSSRLRYKFRFRF